MSDRLKSWLREQLRGLVGVRQCVVDPPREIVSRAYPVDLRALLWTGVIIDIYVLREVVKPRTLKSIVQHNTDEGVGTMFILAPNLVPAPRIQFSPAEWLMVVHALSNERIYTYSPEDREMALMQVHFERIDATEQYETIYGPQVLLERLHYGRASVKLRAIKGYWLTAHFGPTPFWQQERRKFYMPPPRRPSAATGSANGRSSAGSAAAPGREPTLLERSYDVLGVRPGASQEEVKSAFRRQVFNVHPDVSALPKFMAEEKFRVLAEAYEYIKVERGWS